MTETQKCFEQLLQHLHSVTGHKIPSGSNACMLMDSNNGTPINISLPEGSDLLLLDRVLAPLSLDPDICQGRALQLLALNGQPNLLQGAWFYIDDEGQDIKLMTGHPIQALTNSDFENLLYNFIYLSSQMTLELTEEEQSLPASSISTTGLFI
ncbi:MAG: hypothetical protein QS721_03580 [Candidatus Endonucleobacter sp. (ex Gigantidas childressi)]|nr:hypothetical protein [Candidatus Endonucleobacter sp. (ex Gigantidas childressi)]